jgi:hypothetical protein
MDLIRNQRPQPAPRRREMEVKGFRVACGEFISNSELDRAEWEKPGVALIPDGIGYEEGIFTARAWGKSMDPRVADGQWPVFHPNAVGTRQDRIVLVEEQGKFASDRYALKKYHSIKVELPGDTWAHVQVFLLSLNRAHPPIRLDDSGMYRICGWHVGTVSEIHRIERLHYRDAED